jgi:hypothetical protein
LTELTRDWQHSPDHEKVDFCQSFAHAKTRERKAILRFLIQNGDHRTWPAIALLVARELPVGESFEAIQQWCQSCDVGRGANYYQAIAQTQAPGAQDVLRACLDRVWRAEGLMDNDTGCNWPAYDAVCCVEYLVELGQDPESLRHHYDRLTSHACEATRKQTRRSLAQYFEDDQPQGES